MFDKKADIKCVQILNMSVVWTWIVQMVEHLWFRTVSMVEDKWFKYLYIGKLAKSAKKNFGKPNIQGEKMQFQMHCGNHASDQFSILVRELA